MQALTFRNGSFRSTAPVRALAPVAVPVVEVPTVAEPVPEPVSEPVVEVPTVAEPVPEPVPEPVVEPTPETVA
jgi:hypothetical protein